MHVVCFIQNSHDGGRGRVLPPTTCEGALALVTEQRRESEATRKRSYNEIPDSSEISDNF